MKTIYETSDGKQFYDKNAGQKHEDVLNTLSTADEFGKALAKAGWVSPALTRMVNDAKRFILFTETGELPTPPASTDKKDVDATE